MPDQCSSFLLQIGADPQWVICSETHQAIQRVARRLWHTRGRNQRKPETVSAILPIFA